jgi:predicted DNA-binding transcriptional regulator YafY
MFRAIRIRGFIMSTKYERIIWIDREIRAGRYPNAHKIREHFELHGARTAYDDRKFMINRLGAPMRYDRIHNGWYYTDSSYFLPSYELTKNELLAFFLGEELFRRYMGTPFEQSIRIALKRMTQYLPENVSYDMQAETSTFAFTGGATVDIDPELLLELHDAITSRHQVDILYYSASSGESDRRVVDPYHLHNVRGDWYLIAFCHKREQFRDFLVGRIREWETLPSVFQMKRDFSLAEYLAKGFLAERGDELVNIAIKFDEHQARWIRDRQWHPSQQIEELPSGELILHLKVGGIQEVKRWIMGYGPHAEVLEPESLRQQFIEEIEKMKKIYEKE